LPLDIVSRTCYTPINMHTRENLIKYIRKMREAGTPDKSAEAFYEKEYGYVEEL